MSDSISVKLNSVPLASIDETDDISSATLYNNIAFEENNKSSNDNNGYNNIDMSININKNNNNNKSLLAPKQLYQNTNFDSCHSFSSSIFSPTGDDSDDFNNDSFQIKAYTNGENDFVTTDEDYGDTGFFSSSSISMSSKQSSIDFGTIQRNINNEKFHEKRHDDNNNNDNNNNDNNNNDNNDNENNNNNNNDNDNNNNNNNNNNDNNENDDDDDEEAIIEKILYGKHLVSEVPQTPFNSLADQNAIQCNLSNSLENLVNTFDENVRKCLKDFQKDVTEVAPVQLRNEEDFINQRPAWYTLTGEYGNFPPIDWISLAQQTLDNTSAMNSLISMDDSSLSTQCNVEQILNDIQNNSVLCKNADDILDEIEALLSNSESLCLTNSETISRKDLSIKPVTFYRFSLEKLKNLQLDQLQDLCEDVQSRTQEYSQELIEQLALRDEYEFQKEIKSSFINLLIQVHNTRREYIEADFNKTNDDGSRRRIAPIITTTIPYPQNSISNNIPVLQALNKLMKSMLEDNPAISTLLADYILKHVCPTTDRCKQDLEESSFNSFSVSASTIYKSVHRNSLRLLNRS